MQPTVIDEVRTGTYRQLFHPGEQRFPNGCIVHADTPLLLCLFLNWLMHFCP